jgi:thymidylate synthase
MMRYRNTTYALIDGLSDALVSGERLSVRGAQVAELRNRVMVIERPRERCIVLPGRHNCVFATIAETMWILAGRNDLEFLTHYVPRAPDFSDDGRTWRAGYGRRLRDWGGVDQIRECLALLRREPGTRRAVMSLYDPAADFVDSKDIPCNNWFHWLARGDRLHLNVGIRSNDMMWGFSGINTFEWSILQELMASWLGREVGEMTFFISSFHLYQRHEQRARAILERFPGVTCYDYGLDCPRFQVAWENFDEALREWFDLESRVRVAPESLDRVRIGMADPLLGQFLTLIQLYNGARQGWPLTEIDGRLAALPESDLVAAAYEYFHRSPQPPPGAQPSHPAIARYWTRQGTASVGSSPFGVEEFRRAIVRLHAEKSAAYGNSWKRRGELISILSNIARKVDRLERIAGGAPTTRDETLVDTAVDLLIYCLKYQTFLADADPGVAKQLLGDARFGLRSPYSDDLDALDVIAERTDLRAVAHSGECVGRAAEDVLARFADLEACFQGNEASKPATVRAERNQRLIVASVKLIGSLKRESPDLYRRFLATCLGG